MIVVADSSPLNYLIQIESDSLLQKIFQRVLVPAAVIQELGHRSAPKKVAEWLARMPQWIEIRTAIPAGDSELAQLDFGEREAILLAQQERADLLLIDDQLGRREAHRRGIVTTGTLGVLLAAGSRKLAQPESLFKRLISETSFYASAKLQAEFLQRCMGTHGDH